MPKGKLTTSTSGRSAQATSVSSRAVESAPRGSQTDNARGIAGCVKTEHLSRVLSQTLLRAIVCFLASGLAKSQVCVYHCFSKRRHFTLCRHFTMAVPAAHHHL